MQKIKLTFYSLTLGLTLCFIIGSSIFNNASALPNHPIIGTFGKDESPSLRAKAANQIYFIQDCVPGKGKKFSGSSGVCGDTAREIYWSVLSQHFDVIQVSGIFGNIDNEGGFGPTKWQYNLVASPGAPFKNHTFDELYNWPACSGEDCAGGVGSFQITSALGPYLRYIGQEAPDLLDYYKDTKYSANGDELLKIMPKEDFISLVELEVKYVMEVHLDKSAINDFKSKTDPGDAARWWSVNYERCGECTNWNSGENDQRAAAAKQEYDSMGDFTCTSDSSSKFDKTDDSDDDSDDEEEDKKDADDKDSDDKDSDSKDSDSKDSDAAGDGITWIGDSYSVGANNKGLISKNFSDVDFGPGNPDTASSYIKVSKTVSGDDKSNPSCLSILEKVVKNNKLKPNLVFACGTNGTWNDANIKKFKDLLDGKNTKAVVVNSRIPSNDYAEANKLLKKLADENENIALADWASVYSDDFFKSDSIHPNDDPGYEKWVGVISDALSNAKPGCSDATFEGDYPSYPQCGSSWSNESYGDGKTMCSASCGASSIAMLATVAANKDVLPTDVRDLLGGSYYWATSGSGMSALDKKVGEKYGFEVEDVSYSDLNDAEKKMSKYLDDGYMLHFSGAGSYPFSAGGHYIGVFGWTDKDKGKVMLANSGGAGNKEESLHDVIHAGLHGGSFSAIKKGGSKSKCDDNPSNDVCPGGDGGGDSDDESTPGTCSGKVLKSVKDLIALAQKNGSRYPRGADGKSTGGIRDATGFDSILNDGAEMLVDCTGFASLVMYDTFDVKESFWTGSIAGNSNYKEVSKDDVEPGDIFNYNDSANCSAHGGIIIEKNGNTITKIAQTGRQDYITEGWGGKNENIGYTKDSNGSNGNLSCVNNAPDVKYYRYKGCD